MRSRFLSACTALSLCLAATGVARGDALDDLLKKMKDKYSKYKSIQFKSKTDGEMSMSGMTMKTSSEQTVEAMKKDGKILTRTDATTKTTQKMGDQPEQKMDSNITSISDGQFTWMLSEGMGQKTATKQKADPKTEFNPFDPVTMLQNNYKLKLLPDETVNGKPCHVIEMTMKDPMMAAQVGRTVAYYDKDTLMSVKAVVFGKDGKPTATSTTSDIKIDSAIPPDRFVFKAPPGVQVQDMTKGTP